MTFALSAPGGTITLANKEYQLLEALFRGGSVPQSSERLMAKVWGYDSESELNVVWTYLSTLRKKLESLGANVKIKSTRNLGYHLEVMDG